MTPKTSDRLASMGKRRTFYVLPGQRFGRLVVVEERLRERDGKAALWEALCNCDCGETVAVLLQGLKKGTQSCGCTKKKGTMSEKFRATRGSSRTFTVSPGQRFDRLTVMEELQEPNNEGRLTWVAACRCDCGKYTKVLVNNLKSRMTRSCGCLQREHASRIAKSASSHGLTNHPHYARWNNIRARCDNPQNHHYTYYGARGIRMFEEWYNVAVFIDYLETELGPCPEGHSLDRIDNDGHYEPGNIRWADPVTQRHNQRRGTSNGRSRAVD